MLFNRIKMSDDEKILYSKLIDFYLSNRDIFDNNQSREMSSSEKKALIKLVYKRIHYTNNPVSHPLYDSNSTYIDLYRGINGETEEQLNNYVNEFLSGEVFFGKNASIYGTGIYMCTDYDTTTKYATYFNNNYGAILNCKVDTKTNIIDYDNLNNIKDNMLNIIRKKYKNTNIINYLSFLEDDGLFASILGYDAIYVKEKNYVVVLNRGKLIVENIDYVNKKKSTHNI